MSTEDSFPPLSKRRQLQIARHRLRMATDTLNMSLKHVEHTKEKALSAIQLLHDDTVIYKSAVEELLALINKGKMP